VVPNSILLILTKGLRSLEEAWMIKEKLVKIGRTQDGVVERI